MPAQSAINARLGRLLGSPIWAATVSGAVLTVVLLIVAVAVTRAAPKTAGASILPWWAWTGGLCGALVLTATTAVTPRLGAATMIALVMVGQVVCSILLDRFGLLGLNATPLSARRILAAALLIGGAILMSST